MKPCWSCGAQDEPCSDPCDCAKCEDPDAYEEWKTENPDEYDEWLERQEKDDDD